MTGNICKICSEKLFDKINYIDFNKIPYSECKNCGLIYQTNIYNLDEPTINSYYDKEYFQAGYEEPTIHLKNRDQQYDLDKKIILPYFDDNQNQSILDFGCGNGLFLEKFKSQKFGYEVNESITKSKNITYLDNNTLYEKNFDLIIMRGVIEHIKDFDIVLKKLFGTLNKGGLFFITATPNSSCLSFFLDKKNFNQNCKEHLYHFNLINLSSFFLKNNLYNIDTIFQYYETPYANLNYDFKANKCLPNNEDKVSPAAVGNMMSLVFTKME